MNKGLKWIALVGVVVLVLALTAAVVLAQGPGPRGQRGGFGWGHGPGMMGGRGMGPGMMGGWQGMGPGMMGGNYGFAPNRGTAGSGPNGYGPASCPGMGGWGYGSPEAGERISIDEATEAVEAYLADYGDEDLVVVEVMEFSQNFYAEVEEESTGIHAMELLIDPFSGVVYPEYGPNMMWNTKYGHMGGRGGMMGGMMGGFGYGDRQVDDEMSVTPEQAVEAAQAYLDDVQSGLTVDDHADAFYGYYTLHVLEDGQIVGMLSVNGFTGQVWYHNWHGEFIGMTEVHEE